MGAPLGNRNGAGSRHTPQADRTITALVVWLHTRCALRPKEIQQRLEADFGIAITIQSVRTRCWRYRRDNGT